MDARMANFAHNRQPLSAIFRAIAERDEPTVSIAEIMELFGGRAMGALLLVFGLACTLPLPPGSTTIFGAPLVLLAPQLIIGSRAPWLPRRLRERTIATAHLKSGMPRVLPWLERMEGVSRPRLPFLFGAVGERVIGLVCLLLALVLILPIPFGNIVPAIAVSVLSLALVQRDGVLAIFGYLLAGLSGSVLVLAAGLISRGAHHVISVITAA
jgi:hypothetical protein